MRALPKLLVGVAIVAATTCLPLLARAGVIQDENAKAGYAGSWTALDDGTARADGVADVYPAAWSIKPGDKLGLKVRSTTGYDLRIFRLGWYGGRGAREVALIAGQPASPQPYPVADPKFGMADPNWSDSVVVPTDASWLTGMYVARVEQPSGKQALTFFTVRDDGMTQKLPILLIVGTATHNAYNAWPGPERSGKSLYGFNSSPAHPAESIGDLTQAVKVSTARPYFVGAGIADLANYEYPFVRWLEKYGYDVAYATDYDLHRDPNLAKGRRVVAFSGHEEYVSWQMFDNAEAARDSGSNFLILSGDTWSWQVRFEETAAGPMGAMVGYKESWVRDPLQRKAYSLREAGNLDEAKKNFRLVTRGWKNLEFDPERGIDERRPGITFTGVQSAGIIRDASGNPMHGGLYPWGDMVVNDPRFWLFDGTALKAGDTIPNVMGYEVDSTMQGSPEFDKFRPAGQRRLATIRQVSDGKLKGATGFYQKDLGGGKRVEVLDIGAIFFAWALDDFAAKSLGPGKQSPLDPRADQMMKNVFKRWTGSEPIPPVTEPAPGGSDDPTGYDPEKPGGSGAAPTGGGATGSSTCGCQTPGGAGGSMRFIAAVGIAVAIARRRRR